MAPVRKDVVRARPSQPLPMTDVLAPRTKGSCLGQVGNDRRYCYPRSAYLSAADRAKGVSWPSVSSNERKSAAKGSRLHRGWIDLIP